MAFYSRAIRVPFAYLPSAIRLFNSLLKSVRNITDVDISVLKRSLDYFLRTLRDSLTEAFSDNSVNRRIEKTSQLML